MGSASFEDEKLTVLRSAKSLCNSSTVAPASLPEAGRHRLWQPRRWPWIALAARPDRGASLPAGLESAAALRPVLLSGPGYRRRWLRIAMSLRRLAYWRKPGSRSCPGIGEQGHQRQGNEKNLFGSMHTNAVLSLLGRFPPALKGGRTGVWKPFCFHNVYHTTRLHGQYSNWPASAGWSFRLFGRT